MASAKRSTFPSESELWKRPAISSTHRPPPSSGGGPLLPDVDPPPRPRPVLQAVSFALVFAFAALQLFPASHFRHPADSSRSWMPFVSDSNPALLTNTKDPLEVQNANVQKHDAEIERINVVTWTECLNLRVLAVLANSTISTSRLREHVYFSYFVPKDVKLAYYKLKVLFPDSNLDVFGQNEVKEKLRSMAPEWKFIYELTPFLIPSTKPSLRKFIFLSPDMIIQGSIEELFGLDLGPYAIAAAEDCSRRLGDYVDIAILNAIRRTAAKTWISEKPYDKDACMPDPNLLLIDAAKLDKSFLDSVLWWNQVLNLEHERNTQNNIVIAVALYGKYLKLPGAWKVADSAKVSSETKIFTYDGPMRSCSLRKNHHEESGSSNIWRRYLDSKAHVILAN
ncbi:hypothetical protein KSP40_PGU004074 [Platanthera guangdongensis]|uniref:Hexosyltransferase n=1 Tax=Platanthera guangdongensis TaxID=2320717 RepID=A0ABR2LYB0_9ASPA